MLTPTEIHLLERLVLNGLPVSAGSPGIRRARQRGAGLEFHEYRPYHAGDDPRAIDWTVEARLQQLVVRVSRADGTACVHVLVDVSASMGIGSPTKLDAATRLAAALCYVAAARRESASVSLFDEVITRHLPASSSRWQALQALHLLGGATAGRRSALDRALAAYSGAAIGPGLAVILSDFFGPGLSLEGVQALLQRGLTPALVQVVASEELTPVLSGATLLFDIEDADARPLVVDESALGAYRQRVAAHSDSLRAFCMDRGLPWLRVESQTAFGDMLSAAEHAGLFSRYA
jgi:uncharacterized protein (DUF58 family)